MSLIGPPLSVFIATTLVQAINIFHMDNCFCLHSVYPLTQDRLSANPFFYFAARVDLFKTKISSR